MSSQTVVIELNDAAITLVSNEGILHTSPGFALFDGKELLVGDAARKVARHYPRHVHTRFWQQLSTDPLPGGPTPFAQNQADLAFVHLKSICDRLPANLSEIFLAVPGTLTREQLGLLMGMAQALDLPVAGIVDLGVAAASRPFPGRILLHLSLHLNQSIATLIDQGETARSGRVEAFSGFSVLALEDMLARAIADRFIDTTRFDPLQLPATEQELYEKLPAWLALLAEQDMIDTEMEVGGRRHRMTLSLEYVQRALRPSLSQLAGWIQGLTSQSQPLAIQLCEHFNAIPGLLDDLANHVSGCEIGTQKAAASAQRILDHADVVRCPPGDVRVMSQLPWSGADPIGDTVPIHTLKSALPTPTHVVYRGLAYPLSEHPLAVGREPLRSGSEIHVTGTLAGVSRLHCELSLRDDRAWIVDHSTYGTRINGQPVETRAELQPGDEIELGGPEQTLHVVALVDGHG